MDKEREKNVCYSNRKRIKINHPGAKICGYFHRLFYFDFAQWAHGSEMTGPLEYEGTAVWPEGGFATVPFSVEVTARYADGVRLLMKNGDKGVRFDGDEGWIHLTDAGDIAAEPKSILAARDVPRVDWAFMGGHVRNFLECIKSRKATASCTW